VYAGNYRSFEKTMLTSISLGTRSSIEQQNERSLECDADALYTSTYRPFHGTRRISNSDDTIESHSRDRNSSVSHPAAMVDVSGKTSSILMA
jgi:hypothetical protein